MRSRFVKPWNPCAQSLILVFWAGLSCSILCLAVTAAAQTEPAQSPETASTSEASPTAEPTAESTADTTADTLTVVLDAAASAVTFTLGATLHTVEGSFQIEEGEITFDPETGEASGRVVVDATSGDTKHDKRDRTMHAKVLDSDRYPSFVLTPTRIEGSFQRSGSSEVTLHGSLQIHGGEHEISIPATVVVNPAGDELRLEGTGTLEVPYVEWGLEDPSKFLLRVSKSVEVTVRAVGRLRR